MLQNKLTKYFLSFSIVLGLFALVSLPTGVFAQVGPGAGAGGGGAGIIQPPIGATTIKELILAVINWLLGMVGALALLALIVGGLHFIIDFGKEDSVKKGKKIITWAVIGLIVVIISYAIIYEIGTLIP